MFFGLGWHTHIKNQTSGLNRRIIYYPIDSVPDARVPNLFHLDSEKEDLLKKDIPGLINWILSCPEEYISLFNLGGEAISALLNPSSLKLSPLKNWVEENLESDLDGLEPIGNKSDQSKTLYGNYCNWAVLTNLEVNSNLRFSDLLIDTLFTMRWPGVNKKRTKKGMHISGVKFKKVEG